MLHWTPLLYPVYKVADRPSDALRGSFWYRMRLDREMLSEWLRTLLGALWLFTCLCEHGCLSVSHTLYGREEVVQVGRWYMDGVKS